ncbi:MAG TPA: DJ-1/PfpI family protein [Sphingomonas sp.]|nr:DJ-1/PfpI family protein [Sphingomonas sp.]
MPEAAPLHIAFLLFPNVTQLDLTGPAQVLSRLGNARIDLVAATRDPVPTDAQFALLPTASFAEVPRTDILCVPGGLGTVAAMEDEATLGWLRQVAEGAEWVTSVCTGSLLLGAAGLLRGYRATSHWASRDQLAFFGAEPVAGRVVFDRNRVTGGGVTAGIDFALALTAAIRGEEHARFVQLSLEYDPDPPFDSGSPERADAGTLARYHAMVERFAPGRRDRVRAIAEGLGFGRAPEVDSVGR